ncbi:MAG: hypothetical protein GC168_16000 [Candidatus Hydrogenedens sp.]|nr:hypothetical protein [Candidatus Hydrogenedens sp.]
MNPLVQAQLSRLRANVAKLQGRLKELDEGLEIESSRSDELLKKNWRLEKESATLRHNQADYERLTARVEELEALHAEITQHAEHLRTQAARLTQALMP